MGKILLKLDKCLEQKGLTRYYLAKKLDVRYNTVDDYFKNVVTRYDSVLLAKICDILECDISDIMEYIKD